MAARLSLRATGTKQQPATTVSFRPQQHAPIPVMARRVALACRLASSSTGRLASNHATVAGPSPEVAVYSLPFGRSLGADILRMMRDLQVQLRKSFVHLHKVHRPDRDDHSRPLALDHGTPMAPGSHAKP